MESVGILSLPDELLCDIGRYLSMSDILSCSMSCHRLRSALNDNSVWKGFLHSEDLTVFEEKELPDIDIPLQKKLSPLCSNRLHVMRKVKILNNWTHGRCSSHVIQEGCGNTTEGKRRLSSEMSMYRDSFVFLVAEFENFSFVELWDIKKKPILLTHIKYQSVDKVIVVGDDLLIFDKCRIYVHNISIKDNALPLKYVLYENGEDLCLSSLDIECSHKNKTLHKCPFWCHNVYKQFLISVNTNKILIWDFQKSKKAITYNCPCASNISVEFNNSYGSYVLVRLWSPDGSHVKIINIFKEQSLELTQLDIFLDHIVLQDSYFVVFETKRCANFEGPLICSVYNIKSCELISQNLFTVIGTLRCYRQTKIVNGCFALDCQDALVIVDAKTLDIIHTIECHLRVDLTPPYQFNVLSKLFVGARDSGKLNIWNVERKVLLPSLPNCKNEYLNFCLNKWCSKAVYYNYEMETISVLNFSI